MRYTTDDMRNWAGSEPDYGMGGVETAMREAADEIDRLRAALQRIANLPLTQGHMKPDPRLRARRIAVGALGGKQHRISTGTKQPVPHPNP